MADKYLKVGSNGLPTELEATVVSTGASEAGDVVALDAAGLLDSSVLPAGIGLNVDTLPSFENLSAGDWVNVFDDTGTVKVRKADKSNARRAHGFVLAAVTAPANATVYGPGELNDGLTGLTLGVEYFLGDTGAELTTVTTTATEIVQGLGVAKSATAIRFNPTVPIVRA